MPDIGSEAVLINVANEQEALLVEAILKSKGLPSMRRHVSIGEYLNISTGSSFFGIEILVPESLLEQAKELIASTSPIDFAEQEEGPFELDEETKSRQKTAILLIVLFSILPVIIWFVYLMYQLNK